MPARDQVLQHHLQAGEVERARLDDDDYEGTDGIDFRLLEEEDEDGIPGVLEGGSLPGLGSGARLLDAARLQAVLHDLIACRQLLDSALKDG